MNQVYPEYEDNRFIRNMVLTIYKVHHTPKKTVTGNDQLVDYSKTIVHLPKLHSITKNFTYFKE